MTQHGEPIMLRKFSFKRSMLDHLEMLIGLDRGCSLTKIIYVDKANSDKVETTSSDLYIPLTVALFNNEDFEGALFWLKNHAIFPESKEPKLQATGVGSVKYSGKIAEILGREVTFVDEFLSQSRGAYHLLKNVPIVEMTFPPVSDDSKDCFSSPIKEQFREVVGETKEVKSNDDLLPCIFGILGSGGGFSYIGTDGRFRMSSGLAAAGKSFVGLARCIVGTNNYNEIAELAAKGDRRNVDTEIKDLFKLDPPHPHYPPNLPIFHFGKLAETNQSITDFRKEDIAHSLVSMFVFNTLAAAVHVCMAEKVSNENNFEKNVRSLKSLVTLLDKFNLKKLSFVKLYDFRQTNVFLGGNLYQAEIFRREFAYLQKIYCIDFINIYFVNNGHTGALGAMMSSDGDMEKYCHI